MNNLTQWAEEELKRIGNGEKDELQDRMNEDILRIVNTFANQGHSVASASYALGMIRRLLAWKPITPLTGEDDEWLEVESYDDGSNTQQNKRSPEVFRTNYDNSTAFYLYGKVFSNDGGRTWFSSYESKVPITFPYVVPEQPERIILNENQKDH